ncbi:MAG: thioredoxin [Bacteroidales bacterium]|nr:thioredoxin [Bacteroidales bacterium]
MQKFIKTFVFVFATFTLSFAYSQSKPIEINKQDFLTKVADYEKSPEKWVSLAEKPIIVDFYANWCKPCKMISPILDKLAEKYADKIIVYKVNVDKEKVLANEIGIKSIPTLIFVPKNGEPQIMIGAKSEEELDKFIQEFLLK